MRSYRRSTTESLVILLASSLRPPGLHEASPEFAHCLSNVRLAHANPQSVDLYNEGQTTWPCAHTTDLGSQAAPESACGRRHGGVEVFDSPPGRILISANAVWANDTGLV